MNFDEKINIVKIICELQSCFEGYDHKNNCKENQLSIKLKLLNYLVESPQSPYFLTKNIGIAKTNLNLICNELIKEELISKQKETFDKRVISYCITEKGRKFLTSEYEKFGNFFDEMNNTKREELNELIKKMLKLLN